MKGRMKGIKKERRKERQKERNKQERKKERFSGLLFCQLCPPWEIQAFRIPNFGFGLQGGGRGGAPLISGWDCPLLISY